MSQLLAHAGAIEVPREQLATFPVPEETKTYMPVSHEAMVGVI